jgi:hypothetical protein
MGDSIKELVKSLGSNMIQNVLTATVLTAVAAAVALPLTIVRNNNPSLMALFFHQYLCL